MHGFLTIDKPAGPTSYAVTRQIKKISAGARVGHVGTLDPLACGLLLVAVNSATRFIDYLPKKKTYLAAIQFGIATDTFDSQGTIVSRGDLPANWQDRLIEALPEFQGFIHQKAPAFSALKHKGRPLYAYARAGEEVPAKTREVEISKIALLKASDRGLVELEVECGAGVYIRSIAQELGERLGCGAMLTGLRRSKCSGQSIEHAFLAPTSMQELMERLLPADQLLCHLPMENLEREESDNLCNGLCVARDGREASLSRLYDPDGRFLGIGEISSGILRSKRLIPLHDTELVE